MARDLHRKVNLKSERNQKMKDRVITKERPVKLSDGFRNEHCWDCGRRIGYGRFEAVKIDYTNEGIPVWALFHEEGGCRD
jgi:hypothetical protein